MADILNRFLKILMIVAVLNKYHCEINIYSAENNVLNHYEETVDTDAEKNAFVSLVRTRRSADACNANTCLNGAKCLPLKTGGFICACPDGYNGEFCESRMKRCDQLQCSSLSNCMTLGDRKGNVCICYKGGDSFFCSISYSKPKIGASSNPCKRKTCSPGKSSVFRRSKCVCLCPIGYSDKRCQHSIRSIAEAPKSECMMTDQGHVCICSNGPAKIPYLCSRQLFLTKDQDPCEPNPCKNRGICRVNSRSFKIDYTCACPIGYTGKTCLDVMGSCSTMGCYKIRDCVSTPAGGICNCVGKANGKLCKLNIGKPTSWDKLKTVVVEEDLNTMEAVLGTIVGIITLLFICLAVHCSKVNSKRSEIRGIYQNLLKKGRPPQTLPPDWLDISSDMFRQTFCCSKESKLNLDFEQKSSKKSHNMAPEENEEALITLLNSRTDINQSSRVTRAIRPRRKASRQKSQTKKNVHEASLSQGSDDEEEEDVIENVPLDSQQIKSLKDQRYRNKSRNASDGVGSNMLLNGSSRRVYPQTSGAYKEQKGFDRLRSLKDRLFKRSSLKAPLKVISKARRQVSNKVGLTQLVRKYPSNSRQAVEDEEMLLYEGPTRYSDLNRNMNTNTGSSDEDEWVHGHYTTSQVRCPYKQMLSPSAKYNRCRNNVNPQYANLSNEPENNGMLLQMSRGSPNSWRNYKAFADNGSLNKEDAYDDERLTSPEGKMYKGKETMEHSRIHEKYLPFKQMDDENKSERELVYEVLYTSVEIPTEDAVTYNDDLTIDGKDVKISEEVKQHELDVGGESSSQGHNVQDVGVYGVWSLRVELPAEELTAVAAANKDVESVDELSDIYVEQCNIAEGDFLPDIEQHINPHDFVYDDRVKLEHRDVDRYKLDSEPSVPAKTTTAELPVDESEDFKHVRSFEEDGRRLYYVFKDQELNMSHNASTRAGKTGNESLLDLISIQSAENTYSPNNTTVEKNSEETNVNSRPSMKTEIATSLGTVSDVIDCMYKCPGDGQKEDTEFASNVCVSSLPSPSVCSSSDISQTLVATDQSWMSLDSLTDATLVPGQADSSSECDEIYF